MNKLIKLLFFIFSIFVFNFIMADNKSTSELVACLKGNMSNSKGGILNKINDYIDIYNFCRNRNKFDDLEEYLLYINTLKKQ